MHIKEKTEMYIQQKFLCDVHLLEIFQAQQTATVGKQQEHLPCFLYCETFLLCNKELRCKFFPGRVRQNDGVATDDGMPGGSSSKLVYKS